MWNYIKRMLSSLLGHKKDNAPISNTLIVPVKKDCRAYEKPVIDPHKRGRHPLKGDDFKVMDWAKNPEGQINAEIFAYGKIHNAKYKTGCFLWGKGYYR